MSLRIIALLLLLHLYRLLIVLAIFMGEEVAISFRCCKAESTVIQRPLQVTGVACHSGRVSVTRKDTSSQLRELSMAPATKSKPTTRQGPVLSVRRHIHRSPFWQTDGAGLVLTEPP